MQTIRAAFCLVTAISALVACAGPSWEQVRTEDTLAAYRRYLADHPSSKHAPEARERIAVMQVEREPSIEALERFQREHGGSAAMPELTQRVEERAFDAARVAATPHAYARFLASFPNGALTARATGNKVYLEASGFAANPQAIRAFLVEHPESDYAAEAQRTFAARTARQSSQFGAVSLVIEIDPGVADGSRLRAVFSDRAREIYRAARIPLVEDASGATLRIRHAERSVTARESGDLVAKPGVLAETEVSLHSADGSEVFSDRFSWRVSDADARDGRSVLFASSAAPYWDRFYVPVASWPTSSARRASWASDAALAGVGVDLGRAIALSPDGSFRELDLADPTNPRVIGRYRRAGVPARFDGTRRVAGRIVVYGEDGVEVVAAQGNGYRAVAAFDRGIVGAVAGVESHDGKLLIAGTRGLLRAPLDGGPVERLIERPLRGIARVGDTIHLLDEQWLYAGPIADLHAPAFFTIADVGRGLEARSLRASGSLAVVVGGRGVATFALAAHGPARPLARLRGTEIGAVSDAAVIGGSLFVLGERGLLVVDPSTGRVVDSVDVAGRAVLGAAGGHLLAVGDSKVDVVDATPWTVSTHPAAIAR